VAFRDPVGGKDAPLFHPRQQHWGDHFQWSQDYLTVVGLTPTGRATVEALQLNRPGVVNLRGLLYRVGKHPPLFGERPSGSATAPRTGGSA
jgi:hypothetical protein